MKEFLPIYQKSDVFYDAYVKKQSQTRRRKMKTQSLKTKIFLSHKRSTGQAVAGRLFEGLKDYYGRDAIFLDSEATVCK